MQRRTFLSNAALAVASGLVSSNGAFGLAEPPLEHRLPANDAHRRIVESYVEEVPVASYRWASDAAYETFRDMKYGVRIHWGIYSVAGFTRESWPFLNLSYPERDRYNQIYTRWNPSSFDADEWTSFFADCGMRMFAFTTKHHEGFSMFATKARVRQRIYWGAPGGPQLQSCDLAYSIMETPFRRDVMRELCDAGRKRGLHIALYFSHPDWYDADFRPYAEHPAQVPSSPELDPEWKRSREALDGRLWIAPDPTPVESARMMGRHRAQVEELLTNYGDIQMLSFDQWLGPKVWPELRKTLLHIRQLQPNVMLRARGIGNYGDYYTPEGFIPGDKANTAMPWMVIYPLASGFSYDPNAENYKGAKWVIGNIVDTAAKGGGFQVGIGPDANGRFHPTAIEQLKEVGAWLRICGQGIYATRPREGDLWKEGNSIRFTRSKDQRTVYCYALEWPGNTLRLRSVRPIPNSRIFMLGNPHPLQWRFDSATGLQIALPDSLGAQNGGSNKYAWGWTISVR